MSNSFFGRLTATKVGWSFQFTIQELTGFDAGFKELKLTPPLILAIEWKRGGKRTGRTEMTTLTEGGKLDFQQKFDVSSTMFKDKKGYLSKKVTFSLDTYALDKSKVYKKVKNIASGEFNLAQAIGDENEEKKTNQSIPFKLGRSIAFLKVEFVASKPKGFVVDDDDELSEVGSESDMGRKSSMSMERSSSVMDKSSIEQSNKSQELAAKTKEIETLQQQIADFEDQKHLGDIKIKELEDKIAELSKTSQDGSEEEKVAELLKELQSKMDQLAQAESDNAQLTEKIEELKENHALSLQTLKDEHSKAVHDLEATRKSLEEQLTHQKDALTKDFSLKSKEIETKVQQLCQQLESLQKENEELNKLKALQSNLEHDSQELATLKPLLEKVKRENLDLKREKDSKKENVSSPGKDLVSGKERELVEKEKKLKELETLLLQKEEHLKEGILSPRLDKLPKDLEQKDLSLKEREKNLNIKEQDIKKRDTDLKDREKKEQLAREKEKKERDTLEKMRKDKEEEKEKQIAAREKVIQEKEKQLGIETKSVAPITVAINNSNKEIDLLKKQVDLLEKTLGDKEKMISDMSKGKGNEEVIKKLKIEVDSTEKVNQILQDKIVSLNEAIAKATSAQKEKEDAMNSLKTEISNLKNQIEELKKIPVVHVAPVKDSSKDSEFDELQNENTNLKSEVLDLKAEIEKYKDSIEELKEQISSSSPVEKMDESPFQAQIVSLQEQIHKLLTEKQELEASHKEQIANLNKMIKAKTEQIEELVFNASTSKSEMDDLHSQIEKLKVKENDLILAKSQIKFLEDENDEYVEKSKTAETQIENLNDKISRLEDQLEHQKNLANEDANSQNSVLTTRIETLEQELDSLNSDLAHAKEQKTELNNELQKLNDSITKLKAQHAEELEKADDEYDHLKKEYEKHMLRTNDQGKEIDTVHERIQFLELEKSNLKQEAEKAKNQLEHYKLDCHQFEETNAQLKKQITEHLDKIKNMQKENQGNTKVKGEMKQYIQESVEKFILENAILFAPFEYDKEVPVSAKIIFLSIMEWKDAKTNFYENVIKSIHYMIEKNGKDSQFFLYWLNCLFYLCNLVANEENETDVMATFDEIAKYSKKWPSDLFLVFKSNQPSDLITLFVDLIKMTEKIYTTFLYGVFEKLDPLLFNNIFKSTKPQDTSAVIIEFLSKVLSEIKTKIDFKLVNHFFECIANHIDEFIFNTVMRDSNYTSKGIQMKMILSSIEVWLDSQGFKSSKHWFVFSRQAADVCMLAQKSLLTDEQSRKMICPKLQSTHLNRLLQTDVKNDPEFIKKLFIHYRVDFYQIVNPETGKVDKGPIFLIDFDSRLFGDVKIPSRYFEKKECEFLRKI